MASTIRDCWAYREVVRIERLPKGELVLEVHNAMNGHTYSWLSIQKKLRSHDIDHDLYLGWESLCQLKSTWGTHPSLTCDRQLQEVVTSMSFGERGRAWEPISLRTLLVNLRLILIRAGLEEAEGIHLVTENHDGSAKFDTQELWSEFQEWSLHFRNKEQSEHSLEDETTPLLRYKVDSEMSNWSWRRWMPFF